jgi:acyl-CoA reductase-like NAD-dependent aldehyde dehydrogenase
MVGFSGSTRVGKHIGGLCGRLGKRVTLEMGGKNPLVVLKDADLAKAVQGAVIGSFLYQGQICMASSRIYVEKPRMDEFVEKFAAAARRLGMGDLRDESTMLGPIINQRQRGRVKNHLEDAISKGATVRTGGQWDGNRCQPTVLTDVPEHATLYREETFANQRPVRESSRHGGA